VHRHHTRYRARFVGVDRTAAVRACGKLKRKKFVCRVVHWPADSGVETASTS
jgi:hypothetical protein